MRRLSALLIGFAVVGIVMMGAATSAYAKENPAKDGLCNALISSVNAHDKGGNLHPALGGKGLGTHNAVGQILTKNKSHGLPMPFPLEPMFDYLVRAGRIEAT